MVNHFIYYHTSWPSICESIWLCGKGGKRMNPRSDWQLQLSFLFKTSVRPDKTVMVHWVLNYLKNILYIYKNKKAAEQVCEYNDGKRDDASIDGC